MQHLGRMNVLYTSDLHGEIRLYEELLDLAAASSAEIVALGGDLLSSFPPSKRYEDVIPHQKTFLRRFLLPFFKRLLQTTSVRKVFLIPGNWDIAYPFLFEEPIAGIIDLSQTPHPLENGYTLIGYPFVPPTPFRPKDYEKMDDREAPWPPQKNPSYRRSPDHPDLLIPIDPYEYLRQRETIADDLNRLGKTFDYRRTLLITHSPPFGTRLDLIQDGTHAGSRSIKEFILKNQPFMALHGHIHESPRISGTHFEWIGKTLSINPGQGETGRESPPRLHAVTFDMENPKVICSGV